MSNWMGGVFGGVQISRFYSYNVYVKHSLNKAWFWTGSCMIEEIFHVSYLVFRKCVKRFMVESVNEVPAKGCGNREKRFGYTVLYSSLVLVRH